MAYFLGENDIEVADIPALNDLMKQLNPESIPVNLERVQEVMQSSLILTARDTEKSNILVGMGTLVPIQKLFSFCGNIEDVVVDTAYRGNGIGKALMYKLIDRSEELWMAFVELTSRPERTAANELYQSMGFEKRETNVYRLKIY